MASTLGYVTTSDSTASTAAWIRWNCGTKTSTASCYAWEQWNDDCTEASVAYSTEITSTASIVWKVWAQTASTKIAQRFEQAVYRAPELTAEQKAEQIRQQKAAAQQREKEAAQRLKAAERSIALLKSLLTPEQTAEYEKKKRFFVIGSDGNRYEVDCSQPHRNVYEVDETGKRKRGYCANATGNVPVADNHAAQKLAIETDVVAFKKVANSFAVAG